MFNLKEIHIFIDILRNLGKYNYPTIDFLKDTKVKKDVNGTTTYTKSNGNAFSTDGKKRLFHYNSQCLDMSNCENFLYLKISNLDFQIELDKLNVNTFISLSKTLDEEISKLDNITLESIQRIFDNHWLLRNSCAIPKRNKMIFSKNQ